LGKKHLGFFSWTLVYGGIYREPGIRSGMIIFWGVRTTITFVKCGVFSFNGLINFFSSKLSVKKRKKVAIGGRMVIKKTDDLLLIRISMSQPHFLAQ